MKSIVAALLGLLFCSSLVQAEIKCKLRYDIRNYYNWYNFASTIAYGLYDYPPEDYMDCQRCDDLGNLAGELHYAVIDLEDQRQFWINKENITSLRFFEMLTRLLEVYPLFSDLFTIVQELASDPVLDIFGVSKITGIPPSNPVTMVPRQGTFNPFQLYVVID